MCFSGRNASRSRDAVYVTACTHVTDKKFTKANMGGDLLDNSALVFPLCFPSESTSQFSHGESVCVILYPVTLAGAESSKLVFRPCFLCMVAHFCHWSGIRASPVNFVFKENGDRIPLGETAANTDVYIIDTFTQSNTRLRKRGQTVLRATED